MAALAWLALLAPGMASANLLLASLEKNVPESSYAGLHATAATRIWISASPPGSAALQLHRFAAPKDRTVTDVALPKGALLLTGSALSDDAKAVFATAMAADGTWFIGKASLGGKLLKATDLPDVQTATALHAGKGDVHVGGQSAAGDAWLAKLSAELVVRQTLRLPDSKGRQVSSIVALAGKIYLVSNPVGGDGASYLWRLSESFALEDKKKLDGKAATAIAANGVLVVTHTEGSDIYVEAIDTGLRTQWKSKITTRKGASIALHQLCTTTQGLALVGANNSRLFVARIGFDGRGVVLSIDQSTNLLPATSGYGINCAGHDVHIVGLARESGAPVTPSAHLFYFIDRP